MWYKLYGCERFQYKNNIKLMCVRSTVVATVIGNYIAIL